MDHGTDEKVSDPSTEEIQALKRDLANLRNDLKQLLQTVEASGKTKIEDTKIRLTDAKNRLWETTCALETQAGEQLHEACDLVVEQSRKAFEKGRDEIEKRPFITVAGAFLTGMFLGKLFRRK